ncbi:hypothetical protein AXF42_Ash021416 [Apostasia shenzhenica]|uniref:Uncharacterized protein n=1 Tax=Apostasia shenzhenica TaxID=1088818 RepID=A0A2H9ZTW5_9ASPA|nr:hypothetical protein AXF42_Ash021416 [Apostasia shenzhenica]
MASINLLLSLSVLLLLYHATMSTAYVPPNFYSFWEFEEPIPKIRGVCLVGFLAYSWLWRNYHEFNGKEIPYLQLIRAIDAGYQFVSHFVPDAEKTSVCLYAEFQCRDMNDGHTYRAALWFIINTFNHLDLKNVDPDSIVLQFLQKLD